MKSLLILSLIQLIHPFLDYTNATTVNCRQIGKYQNVKGIFWHTAILHQIDKGVFIIACPIACFGIVFIFITYIKFPQTLKPPGGIILCMTFSDLILVINWFLTALYSYMYPYDDYPTFCQPQSYVTFCTAMSVMGIVGGAGQFIYNCLFCIYLLLVIKITVKKGKNYNQIYFHITALLIILGVIGYAFGSNSQGLGIFGTCSLKITSYSPFIGLYLVLFYFVLSMSTIYQFKKFIPQTQQFRLKKQLFLVYYNKYIAMNCIIWGVLALSMLFTSINCQLNNPIAILGVFITIGNISKIGTPLILTLMRYQNPVIRQQVNKLVKDICCCLKKDQQKKSTQKQPLLRKASCVSQMPSLPKNWIDNLTQSIRQSNIITLLYFLNNHIKNYRKIPLEQLQQKDYKQKQTVFIKEKQFIYKNVPVIKMEVQLSAKRVFQAFLNQDQLDLSDSFRPGHYFQGSDGGKGGQFFLFTDNHKAVIKSISSAQKNVYLQRLNQFVNHFKQNRDSLIVKFYGLFQFSKAQLKFNIFVMKNLSGVNKKFIQRVYDLKGSTFARKVLKQGQLPPKAKTLKDNDFDIWQQRLWIKQQMKQKVRNALIKDSQFLRKVQLIDYSLIIMKINWQQMGVQPQQTVYRLVNTREEGVWYHIGIIDYLQVWNMNKFAERGAKKILNINKNIDPSSQDPVQYSKRFIEYIKKIV